MSLDSRRPGRRLIIATLSIFIGIAIIKCLHDLLLSSDTLFVPTHPTLSKRLGHYLSASALKCYSMIIGKGDNVYLLSQAIINIIEQHHRCNSLMPLMAKIVYPTSSRQQSAGAVAGSRCSFMPITAPIPCCRYPAHRPFLIGCIIICRLPHSDRHLFSAVGSRGIGWPSLLVFASHRPFTLLPLPRPPPLSKRIYL